MQQVNEQLDFEVDQLSDFDLAKRFADHQLELDLLTDEKKESIPKFKHKNHKRKHKNRHKNRKIKA